MWAQIRQSNTSLSSGWRDDTPQEICALKHDSLYNAQASRFILCHVFKDFTYSFESPFRRTYFNLEDAFVFLPISVCLSLISTSHHFGGAVCVRTTFYLFQKFFGTIGLVSLPASLSRHAPECFSLSLLQERITSTFLVSTGPFPTFSTLCHDALSFPRLPSAAKTSTAPGPVPLIFRCNTADTNFVV